MSDKGEKTCPLCTEEMDLTDQQLKPCKCGYEICVWCWHQIMDMAEKNDSYGRCPACRTPYDKEKIVGMAAKCESLVAEIHSERKKKMQKAKPKASNSKKNLINARVIQRNLAHIMGLPLDLADEDLLQRKEYFGQYGRVLKVSVARTTNGVIQHSSNNFCSVYITYSKEEEAVRCIQSVHNFVLEGRPLRACFGTTKYCHSWLKNVPCSNSDCLYLHNFGAQEDTFDKDEIATAFARVQEITGANNNQRRSGNILPPPVFEHQSGKISAAGKPVTASVLNNITQDFGPCLNGSSGKPIALPAAGSWVKCVSSSHPPALGLSVSEAHTIQKLGMSGSPSVSFSDILSTKKYTSDVGNRSAAAKGPCVAQPNNKLLQLGSRDEYTPRDCQIAVSNAKAVAPLGETSYITTSNDNSSSVPASKKRGETLASPSRTSSIKLTRPSSLPGSENSSNAVRGNNQDLSSDMSLLGIKSNHEEKSFIPTVLDYSIPNNLSVSPPGSLQEDNDHYFREPSSLQAVQEATKKADVACNLKDEESFTSARQDSGAFDSVYYPPSMTCSYDTLPGSSQSSCGQLQESDESFHPSPKSDPDSEHKIYEVPSGSFPLRSFLSDGFVKNNVGTTLHQDKGFLESPNSSKIMNKEGSGKIDDGVARVDEYATLDLGENSIISNILALDMDPWEDSMTTTQDLITMLSRTDEKQGSHKVVGTRNLHNSKQSRFSFARGDDFPNPLSDLEYIASDVINLLNGDTVQEDIKGCKDTYKSSSLVSSFQESCNGSAYHSVNSLSGAKGYKLTGVCVKASSIEQRQLEGSICLGLNVGIHRVMKTSGASSIEQKQLRVPRRKLSTPPGFAAPSRMPPPGFSPIEMDNQALHGTAGNQSLQNSLWLESQFQAPPPLNSGNIGDVEFNDPAILAVGRGIVSAGLKADSSNMRLNLSPQFNHQTLLQHSVSSHENMRFSDQYANRFPFSNDAYSIPSGFLQQSQGSNISPFMHMNAQQCRNPDVAYNPWQSRNDIMGTSDLGISELLSKQRMGSNKFMSNYEDFNFQMSGLDEVYSRGFIM
ncbi:RNA recognition motif domain [Dillenia turbinata]|uniref:RNA recognition motif domain n=1 Tax=Dillenia turbinata TaxID=194707 RepID=A0AAN8W0F4_9MAGN